MSSVRIDLDRAGVRHAALTSPEIRAEIARRAEKVAAATRGKTDNEVVVASAGKSRARSYVRMLGPEAAADEAKSRPLGSSIDAAR